MKIKIENLGVLKKAEFDLGEFTILCGGNNTGKTYATYALFGFLSFWREAFALGVSKQIINELLTEGSARINIQNYVREASGILRESCNEYITRLPMVFASSAANFSAASFFVTGEYGTWMISGDEKRFVKSFLTSLSAISTPEEYAIGVIPLIKRDSYESFHNKVYATAIKIAGEEQMVCLKKEVKEQEIRHK